MLKITKFIILFLLILNIVNAGVIACFTCCATACAPMLATGAVAAGIPLNGISLILAYGSCEGACVSILCYWFPSGPICVPVCVASTP